MKTPLLRTALTGAFLFVPGLAMAHPGPGDHAGFAHGFIHPIGGLDHVLAMVMVGLFAAQLGGRALWRVPAAFLSVMALGGLLGAAGFALPFVEIGDRALHRGARRRRGARRAGARGGGHGTGRRLRAVPRTCTWRGDAGERRRLFLRGWVPGRHGAASRRGHGGVAAGRAGRTDADDPRDPRRRCPRGRRRNRDPRRGALTGLVSGDCRASRESFVKS